MSLKETLLKLWRGDPKPPFDPDNPEVTDRPLTRSEINELAEREGENEPGQAPRGMNVAGGPLL